MQKRTNQSDAPDFQSSANRRAFVKLDLSRLSGLNPNKIESVSFDFYQNGNGGTTENMDARVVDIDPNSWEEMTLKWTNMPPTYNLTPVALQNLSKKENEYQSIDITEYIKSKISEGTSVISFSLDNEPANEWGLIWYSREASKNRPRLTIKVAEPTLPEIYADLYGTSANLMAVIDQYPQETTEVRFFEAKNIELNPENTVVYSGETSDMLPDAVSKDTAETSEVFSFEPKTTTGIGKTPFQIYEISLTDEEQNMDYLDFSWTGNTAGHERNITIYFYNNTKSKWEMADSGSSVQTFSLNASVPVRDALDSSGKIQLLIWRGMNRSIEGRSSYVPDTGEYDFNIIWSTDTQYYTTLDNGMQHVKKQFEWIYDNFDDTKSKLFIHTGDMVENYDSDEQWQAMSDIYADTIEASGIPYAFTVGNHDVNNGSVDDTGKYGAETTIKNTRAVIENNENVKLVLCGHWTGASTNLEYFGDRAVWSLMHDYQGYTEGGYGYFRQLKFDIENNLIYTHTYSASTSENAVYTDKQPEKEGLYQKHRDEYAISFDFNTDSERVINTDSIILRSSDTGGRQIGDTQKITGCGTVSVTWDTLEKGSTYSWYAVTTNDSGEEFKTGLQTFTVPDIEISEISYSSGEITVDYSASGIADGEPISIIAFDAKEATDENTIWSNQNVAYHDVISHNASDSSISFHMPLKTENNIAGLDTTKSLIIRISSEHSAPASKLFNIPETAQDKILSVSADETEGIEVQLSRPVQGNEHVIAVVYDNNGIILRAKLHSASDTEYLTIPALLDENSYKIKIMWWDGLDTMKPICNAAILEKANDIWQRH